MVESQHLLRRKPSALYAESLHGPDSTGFISFSGRHAHFEKSSYKLADDFATDGVKVDD